MTNKERRELLSRFRQSGMQGSILDVLDAAKQGRDLISEFQQQQQRQQPLVATTPEEQREGLRPYHAAGETDRSMIFKDVPPNTPFNTIGMKKPINIEKRDPETGHLIESHTSVPPGIRNIPTGPYEGDVIETPADGYRDGGFVFQKGGAPIATQQSIVGFGTYPDLPEGYTLDAGNNLVPEGWSEYHEEDSSGDIDIDRLKMGLRFVESSDGLNMINPESTATGFYGQRFSEIDGENGFTHNLVKEGMTREVFAADTTLQNRIFEERVFKGLGKEKSMQTHVDDLTEKYQDQLGEKWQYDANDLAALVNLLGREGTRRYLGYVVRDGKSLAEIFPKKYGPNAEQHNKTPQEYLDIVREHSVRPDGFKPRERRRRQGGVRKMQSGSFVNSDTNEADIQGLKKKQKAYLDALSASGIPPYMKGVTENRQYIRDWSAFQSSVSGNDPLETDAKLDQLHKLKSAFIDEAKRLKELGLITDFRDIGYHSYPAYGHADRLEEKIRGKKTALGSDLIYQRQHGTRYDVYDIVLPPKRKPPKPAPEKIKKINPKLTEVDIQKDIIIPPRPPQVELDELQMDLNANESLKDRRRSKRPRRSKMYRRTLKGALKPRKRKFKKQGK